MTRARVRLRGGAGPPQPEWEDISTYSAEWYRRFRGWHRRRYPGSDVCTRQNLAMLIRVAEEAE